MGLTFSNDAGLINEEERLIEITKWGRCVKWFIYTMLVRSHYPRPYDGSLEMMVDCTLRSFSDT